MPWHFRRSNVKLPLFGLFGSAAAEQQVGSTGTAMFRLGRRDREDMWPQRRPLKPSRNQVFQNPRPALPAPPSGNYQHAAPPHTPRLCNEAGQSPVRLGLSQSMQIKPCLDPMASALQPFCVGAVDPGKTIERGRLLWPRRALSRSRQSSGDNRRRNCRCDCPLAAQRPHVANRFYP